MKRTTPMRLMFVAAILFVGCGNVDTGSDRDLTQSEERSITISQGLDAEEIVLLEAINQHRANNGLGPLQVSVALSKASNYHSVEMATNDYFSHTLLNGVSWSQNACNYGYCYNTSKAENIAAGNSSGQSTFVQWKNSPGHNTNMLGSGYKVIGIGRAPGGTYGWYWTTLFGGTVDEVMTAGGGSCAGSGTGGSGGSTDASACAHSYCSTGSKLKSNCDPCVFAICGEDPYCCQTTWDTTCENEVETICGLSCAGGTGGSGGGSGTGGNAGTGGTAGSGEASLCGHSYCSTGSKLKSNCDPCVTTVCGVDSYCCQTSWDYQCVSEADQMCSDSCW